MPMAIEKAPASTAVTIVGSTPTYGMGAYKAQRDQEEAAAEGALGLYSTAEPPKKRQRSAAAVLFGAAFETVIFTSAVALSAYQLLTGKGRQQGLQDDGASTGVEGETAPVSDDATSANQSIVNGHGLSASLPHSNPHEPDHPFYERAMIPPKRPNTGTEDNDPQFLRMEAQLSTLIAEGKRALSSRIQDHH
ncbi:hypothetical protein BGZ95_003275 [Linnemannia exigua]|uniref:Transmembrane protein n=1 Tax=Linnemannia exigua TaxID=604196 RepID=A0AAD4DIA9_9FUNG|nr:hypothetical protein BGZ95_003275 [Linnemannia exigua]